MEAAVGPLLHVPDMLNQHEKRIAAMLETHKCQVIDALAKHLSEQMPFRPSLLSQDLHNRKVSVGSQRHSHPRSEVSAMEPIPDTLEETEQRLEDGIRSVTRVVSLAKRDCCTSSALFRSFRHRAKLVYESTWFEAGVSVAILVNAVVVGIFAERSIQDPHQSTPIWYRVGSAMFLAFFIVELAIRWMTEGCIFFFRPRNLNFGWNVFDSVLIVTSVMDELLELLQKTTMNVSFVRLARILRVMRVTRMLKVLKQFKDLKIMVHGMLNCGRPLCWSSLLLALLAYIYNVFMLQISSEWLRTLPDRSHPDDADYPQETVDYIHANFGSLLWGMYTLLKCITGGVSWEEIADPLTEISPLLVVAFLLYVLLGVACLLNLITAVFLDAAYHTSQGDEAQILEHIEQKRAWISAAKDFFSQEFESQGINSQSLVETTLEVTVEDFVKAVQAPRVRRWFEENGLDVYFEDAKSIFDLIDVDADERIGMHDFVVGLYRLKGEASSLTLQLELKNALARVGRVEIRLRRYHADILKILKAERLHDVSVPSETATYRPWSSEATQHFRSLVSQTGPQKPRTDTPVSTGFTALTACRPAQGDTAGMSAGSGRPVSDPQAPNGVATLVSCGPSLDDAACTVDFDRSASEPQASKPDHRLVTL